MQDSVYYGDSSNFGSYQYLPLTEIVSNFLLQSTGDNFIINNTSRFSVVFCAKRGIQELHYDAAKETLSFEGEVSSSLKMVMPSDFVNYIKVYREVNGNLIQLEESNSVISARAMLRDSTGATVYDSNGNAVLVDSDLDLARINGDAQQMSPEGYLGWFINDEWYYPYNYPLLGIDMAKIDFNPTFRLDKKAGVINFSSGMSGEKVVIEYFSDGMKADDADIMIHKMAEEYLYMYIKWALLNGKSGIPEYVVNRARRDKMAALRNTKIRLGNNSPSKLKKALRGALNWIK